MPFFSQANSRHAQHYLIALQKADQLCDAGGASLIDGLHHFDLDRTNIIAGHAWATHRFPNDIDAVRLCADYNDSGPHCLTIRLPPLEQIQWLKTGLKAAELLKDRESELAHLGNLGNAQAAVSNSQEAIQSLQEAISLTKQLNDLDSEGLSLNNLGTVYAEQLGDAKTALGLFQKALEISHQTGNKHSEGNALDNIGNAYWAMGETKKAIEFSQQHLRISAIEILRERVEIAE